MRLSVLALVKILKPELNSVESVSFVSFKGAMKFSVSVALLLLAYASLDTDVLLSKLAKFTFQDICFFYLLYFVGQLISARKWHLLLLRYREASFLEVARSYFLGMFLNIVGLGTLGGDLVRVSLIHI